MNIGFFDSGLGGLSILRAVARELLQYDYVFYGDTANLPYGDRTEGDIYELTKTGVRWLFDHDSALVIIACNTASAETARRLQQEFLPAEYPDRNILGVIVPTIEALNFEKPTKAVLLATKRTIESGKYQAELDMKGSGQCDLISIATPELVPLIEMHEIEQATKQAIARIQSEAGDSKVVVLGCTHYTKLKDALRTQLPNKLIVSQDEIIPKKLATYLTKHSELTDKLSNTGERMIHLTKHRPDYDQLMGYFLGGVYMRDESNDSK